MLTQRPVDLDKDRDFVLDLGCMGRFESLSAAYRNQTYRAYRDRWFKSRLPDIYLSELTDSLEDERTIADIWEEDGQPAGFAWVSFEDTPLGRVVGTVHTLVVAPGHQRRGIGTLMLQDITGLSRDRNAGILRVETSVENEASQAIATKEGFGVARLVWEKVLDPGLV